MSVLWLILPTKKLKHRTMLEFFVASQGLEP